MNSEENKITGMSLPGILKKINFSGKNNNENWIDKFSEFVREIIKLSDGKVGWFKKNPNLENSPFEFYECDIEFIEFALNVYNAQKSDDKEENKLFEYKNVINNKCHDINVYSELHEKVCKFLEKHIISKEFKSKIENQFSAQSRENDEQDFEKIVSEKIEKYKRRLKSNKRKNLIPKLKQLDEKKKRFEKNYCEWFESGVIYVKNQRENRLKEEDRVKLCKNLIRCLNNFNKKAEELMEDRILKHNEVFDSEKVKKKFCFYKTIKDYYDQLTEKTMDSVKSKQATTQNGKKRKEFKKNINNFFSKEAELKKEIIKAYKKLLNVRSFESDNVNFNYEEFQKIKEDACQNENARLSKVIQDVETKIKKYEKQYKAIFDNDFVKILINEQNVKERYSLERKKLKKYIKKNTEEELTANLKSGSLDIQESHEDIKS